MRKLLFCSRCSASKLRSLVGPRTEPSLAPSGTFPGFPLFFTYIFIIFSSNAFYVYIYDNQKKSPFFVSCMHLLFFLPWPCYPFVSVFSLFLGKKQIYIYIYNLAYIHSPPSRSLYRFGKESISGLPDERPHL